jgi:hypothetical protein
MNKNQNTETHSFAADENNRSFFGFLQRLFEVKGVLNFDVCGYSNTFHEKLPIIYANIRV